MRAGLLRSTITIQAPTETETELGERGIEWKNLYSNIRCEKKRLSGKEKNESSGLVTEVSYQFRLRYMPNINNQCRIVSGGDIYNIVDVDNVKDRNRELIIQTQKVGRGSVTGL